MCYKLDSGNKIIGDLKNGEIRIFFVILEQIRVVLGVFRGTCVVANFFTAILCVRNGIPAIKLLAISKTAKLELSCEFLRRMGVVERVPRYLHRCQFFYS